MFIITALWGSLRVRQWTKNAIVFAPLFFSGKLLDQASILHTWGAFLCFCATSSAVYLLNDLLDRKRDCLHPVKKDRPLASGRLPVSWAIGSMSVLAGGSLAYAFFTRLELGFVLLAYLFMTTLYSLRLKRVLLIDVLTVSVGFVIRIWGGAVVLDVVPSHWIQLSMFFLAVFLSLLKRRQELLLLHGESLRHRRVLSIYTQKYIDQLIPISTAVTIICYALYTISPDLTARIGPSGLIYTVPLVIYGLFRYLFLIHIQRLGYDPTEAVLSDRPLMLSVLLWLIVIVLNLYL